MRMVLYKTIQVNIDSRTEFVQWYNLEEKEVFLNLCVSKELVQRY